MYGNFWKIDLKKYFRIITISGDVNKREPHPEIFRKASETLFVGETPT
ncbi:MAG: hypothetical protein N3F10_05585 [Candidatus Bathyarchaeota archaeon]|nr:hypothetical protein [Candidatus Bathyarchaeota archaeon]